MLGLLYDVHGNLPALEAVLDDARELPVDRWLVGGDVALFGAWPGETVARLGELAGARWIRGNTERWLVDRSDAPPFVDAVVADVLHELDVDALSTLPSEATEGGTCFVHASPVSDMRSFGPAEPADDEDELLAGETHARLVFGRTHLQFTRTTASGVELVNPSSVGLPLDGDHRAAYALIDDIGSVVLRRVAYNHRHALAVTRERYGEAPFVGRLERAAP